MKKRMIASLAILAVFGLAIATYAYNQSSSTAAAKASCCKSGDSCPMKAKMGHAKHGEKAGESCPMKKQAASMQTVSMQTAQTTDAHSCCDCCGDSCPMKKEGGITATASSSSTEKGKDCCDNCDCCSGKAETAV